MLLRETGVTSPSQRILLQKLQQERAGRPSKRRRLSLPEEPKSKVTLTLALDHAAQSSSLNQDLSALVPLIPDVTTTPYETSFASRLYGRRSGPSLASTSEESPLLIYRDWEVEPPWVKLMDDIKRHYHLKNYGIDAAEKSTAPIEYVSLHQDHLNRVHELLTHTFWPGIDVSSALKISTKGYTIVATYKHLVVGTAFIAPPPDEAYLTYVAFRSGWEHSRIALTMLYYLITSSGDRDIILHVSANNPALILYNKLGFKSEEFVVGFYQDYLDPQSRACRNALRLRLRQRQA